ncbi:MAG: tetratricopeptide repeat protein [Chloroflexi bacterium]|nr:tetratricopeptide repeat protein [Chloroflexota bacterium]
MQNLQVTEHFIGRNDELKIFTTWLADPRASRVLYFHDALEEREKKGGIGKTWLLRRCLAIARHQRPDLAIVSIDFFNVGDRDGVVVAERIVAALRTAFPDWVPSHFSEAIAEYRNVNKPESVELTEVRSTLFKALTTDLQQLDQQLGSEKKALLVFYDTYELIEENPVIAALRFSQRFPDNYQFERMYAVVAGRNALDWAHPNWKGREDEVRTIALAPFSQSEMVAYIDAESLYDLDMRSEQIEALYLRTEGRPILIGLATDVLNKHIMTLERLAAVPLLDFESHLVMQINNLEHPLNWIILFMAHAYHRFNLEMLDWLLHEANLKRLVQDVQYDELVRELPSLSFVRKSGYGDDFVLHDEMRRLVTKYCWPIHDKYLRYRHDISRKVIEYYEHAMTQEPSQQMRQTYRIEILYHKLFLDVNAGFKFFDEHFYRALSLWQSPFARTFLQELQQFEHNMSSDQHNHLQLALARLLREENNPAGALDIYLALERQADQQWVAEHRLDLLSGKGICYLDLNRFLEAIDSFSQCLEIDRASGKESAIANRLSWLGLTYRRRGQYDTAERYYEESIALHKRLNNQREYASMLTNISNVYRLQGKTDEALRRCKIALRIRKDLFQAGRGGEVAVGLTLSTIGQVYLSIDDIVHAEQAFQQAYEIYIRANHRKFIAGTLNRLGQIEMAKDNLQEAKRWFERAQEASVTIDTEAYINSLNKQGRVLAKQGCWAEAAVFFEQAVDLTRQLHDDYQRTESLVDLAEALKRQGQHQQAQQYLQEAEQISVMWNYFHLLGRAAEFQGDMDYDAGRYWDAFIHYREYCYNMARRNALEYNKALQKLTDRLVAIPTDQIHPIVDELVSYWFEQHMDKDYPDFVKACQEVDDSLDIARIAR